MPGTTRLGPEQGRRRVFVAWLHLGRARLRSEQIGVCPGTDRLQVVAVQTAYYRGGTGAADRDAQRSDPHFFEKIVGGTVPLSLASIGGAHRLDRGGVGNAHLEQQCLPGGHRHTRPTVISMSADAAMDGPPGKTDWTAKHSNKTPRMSPGLYYLIKAGCIQQYILVCRHSLCMLQPMRLSNAPLD